MILNSCLKQEEGFIQVPDYDSARAGVCGHDSQGCGEQLVIHMLQQCGEKADGWISIGMRYCG